jgi:hypothetical protein
MGGRTRVIDDSRQTKAENRRTQEKKDEWKKSMLSGSTGVMKVTGERIIYKETTTSRIFQSPTFSLALKKLESGP